MIEYLLKMKKRVFLIPGAKGAVPFMHSFKQTCGENIDCAIIDSLPTEKSAKKRYPDWRREMNIYVNDGIRKGMLDFSRDKFITHSLANSLFPKWMLENGVNIDTFVAVAPCYPGMLRWNKNKIPYEIYLRYLGFTLTDDQLAQAGERIREKHLVYSNDDHRACQKKQERFGEIIGAKPHFVPNCGHFGSTSGVNKIDILEPIIIGKC